METDSQPESIAQAQRILEGQIRECYGRVVYSHKTHEKCADILLSRLSTIKLLQLVLSAAITGGLISTFLGTGQIGTGVSVVLSAVLLGLNAYTKDYDLGEIAQKHKHAAGEIWLIRETYLSLLIDLKLNAEPQANIRNRRDSLMNELHQIYIGSPSTNFLAYKKAQKALQAQEEMTFSEQEIDAFLPDELKRS